MDVKKLKVGHYVYGIRKHGNGKPEKVIMQIRLSHLTECKPGDIEPIPLTTELMEKFGFESSEFTDYLMWWTKDLNSVDIYISITNDSHTPLVNIYDDVVCFNIRYVHELQDVIEYSRYADVLRPLVKLESEYV